MKLFLGNIALQLVLYVLFVFLFFFTPEANASRIKEIANYEGIRGNHLIGYGLVVGLEGQGDKSGTGFTTQSLANMLNRFGVRIDANSISVKNVASVVVTADLSPLAKPGSSLDVTVSSIGDAKSLQGGTLLFTPLSGADGEVYAVAQGPVSIGGFLGGGDESKVQKNFLTVGRVPAGALVERDIPLSVGNDIAILLKNPDFTTSSRIAGVINTNFGPGSAHSVDATKVWVRIPDGYRTNQVDFLSMVETLDIPVDTISKVVVNERTGTIVIGQNVKLSTVAVSHGNLTVEIQTSYQVSQPSPFSRGGTTAVVPETSINVEEEDARLIQLDEGTNLGDLVGALNALGVTPRDLIAILQAIRSAGALQAELELI